MYTDYSLRGTIKISIYLMFQAGTKLLIVHKGPEGTIHGLQLFLGFNFFSIQDCHQFDKFKIGS